MASPPLLLIHGAANGAWVWDVWRRHLQPLGWEVNVLDLRGHGRSLPADLGSTTMEDYLSDVESVTPQIVAAQGQHPVIGGWGMGGLPAVMYAPPPPETAAPPPLPPQPAAAGRGPGATGGGAPDAFDRVRSGALRHLHGRPCPLSRRP